MIEPAPGDEAALQAWFETGEMRSVQLSCSSATALAGEEGAKAAAAFDAAAERAARRIAQPAD